MSTPITLDIFSDPICPWCYIGLKRLDRALEELGRDVRTTWRCFMLNPDMPDEGMDRRTYLERKFGGPAGADRVYGAIEGAAQQAGIAANFAAIQRTPATRKAHQALRQAQETDPASADRLIRALFTAYFEKGQDIGDEVTLQDLWEGAKLPPKILGQVFAEDRHLSTIRQEHEQAQARGISGVPFFIVNGTYALSGAQDAAAFARVFDMIESERKAA